MANTKEIQKRMKSISDTMKITNAMYMIFSTKLQHAKSMLADTEPYFYSLQQEFGRILRHVPETDNIYFRQISEDVSPDKKKIGYVVVSADKGLAGAYNHNVFKMAHELFEQGGEKLKLLLLSKEKFATVLPADVYQEELKAEPSWEEVLNHLVPNYVNGFIYGALVESYASEQNSRMMAMQSATDSAKEILQKLSIEYNRVRQAAITQEITEVISGAKAQKRKKRGVRA